MPRLQIARRTSLLSTRLRAVFLESFERNVFADTFKFGERRVSRTTDLLAVARRVQTDIRQATGRYCSLYQVISSIHDLGFDCAGNSADSGNTTRAPTPRLLPIVITPTEPNSSETFTIVDGSSMSRRRIARKIPALQCRLSIPPLALPSFPRPTGKDDTCPITPVDQIARTPLTPPKIPHLVPPPPRAWAHLHAEGRKDELSSVGTPTLPLIPYLLDPMNGEKPTLNRLRIPGTGEDCRPAGAQSSPSSQTLSPLDLGKGYFPGGASPTLEGARAVPGRANSASSLTRVALVRSFSQTLSLGIPSERPLSPLGGPVLGSPLEQPLASPFTIRSEGVGSEYFCV